MYLRTWYFILVLLVVLAGCSGGDAPGTSASESSGAPPSTGEPDEPSTGGEPGPSPTTGSGTTGEPPAESSSGEPGSTGAAPYCGDDRLDPGEECDFGRDNGENAACTHLCTKATCGDGFLWEGYESCDLGLYNLGQYGGCTADCELAPRCNDGTVDEPHEDCDYGDLNGEGVGMGDMGPCDDTCQFQGRTVFVTSVAYEGNLGGLSGADLKCKSLAAAGGLAEATHFRAWLSDGFNSPATRFEEVDISGNPYLLLDGRVVADSFSELVESGPRTGISITETGQSLTDVLVWTNTSPFGEVFSPVDHCAGWLSADVGEQARGGYNALAQQMGPAWETWKSERRWTSYLTTSCNQPVQLYCFEDGPGGGG
jgi:hypothetical protein